MPVHHKNFIGGEWVAGATVTRNINPSNTNDVVGEYAQADARQASTAIAAAKAAAPGWSRSTPQERHDALKKISDEIMARKEELGELLAREEGKTRPEGIGEVTRAGQIFDFFAGEALRLVGEKVASVRPGIEVEMTREAVGVVGIIAPWNFPIAIPAWKIAPALCYGNAVVFKPADLVPGSAHALSDMISRSSLPKGVFNLVMVVAPSWARRFSTAATSMPLPLPGRSRQAARWRVPAWRGWRNSSSRWEARTRWSCSTTRT
jgi:acyl-CoA reductase-like NAD-dependent aldehyde dehydrogenase